MHDPIEEKLRDWMRADAESLPFVLTDALVRERLDLAKARTWRAPLFGAVAAVAVAAVALVVILNLTTLRVAGPSPTPSVPATTAASPSTTPTELASASASASVESSPSPSPTAVPTATPEPTIVPRTGWSTVFSVDEDEARIAGIAEARGRLFALGQTGSRQPAIWVSNDGTSWALAGLPAMSERYPGSDGPDGDLGGFVVDLQDAGDRLVAVAALGLASGSGLFGTMVYVSDDDGLTWAQVDATPGVVAAAIFDLARSGDRLIGVGTAAWASDDGGLTWTEVMGGADIGGTLYAVDARDDLVVAVGDAGNGDLTSPPAIALVSRDGGDTWQQTVLHPDRLARSVAVGASGRIVVGGYVNEGMVTWVSDDSARTWTASAPFGSCCVGGMVATPTGYAAVSSMLFEGVLLSVDGISWNTIAIPADFNAVSWGPSFGLAVAARDEVLLGPVPAP